MPRRWRRRRNQKALPAPDGNLNKHHGVAAQQAPQIGEPLESAIQEVNGPEPVAVKYGGEQNAGYGDQQQAPPSVVIPWIFKEIAGLQDRLSVSYHRDLRSLYSLFQSIPDENKQQRVTLRKTQYPAFAEALLQSWLHEGEESFKDVFCEQTWGAVAGNLPPDAPPPDKVPEVELFLEEFLGGKEFGLSTKVTVGGRCGDQLVPTLFRSFSDKVRTAGVQNLHLKTILRAQNFLNHLVNGSNLLPERTIFSYPEWAVGLPFNCSWNLRRQYGGLYSEFETAVNNCSVKQEAERATRETETRLAVEFRNSLMQRAPKGPGHK